MFKQVLYFSLALLILTFNVVHQLGFDQYQHNIPLVGKKSSEIVQRCVLGCISPKMFPLQTKKSSVNVGDVIFHQGVAEAIGFPQDLPVMIVDYQFNRTNFLLEWKRVQKSNWYDVSERYSYSDKDGYLRIKVTLSGYITLILENWLAPFDSFHYYRLASCIGQDKKVFEIM